MIYLKLFLTFLEIGALSFGGGFGMISLINEKILSSGWMTEEEFLNMIAIAESTPGPIAVNMATFVGSTQGGLLGSFLATLGVVLPSFIIILIISALIKNLLKFPVVQGFLKGVRPCVVGLVLATAVLMANSVLIGGESINAFDYKGAVILLLIVTAATVFKRLKKKNASPIALIIISAVLGIILY